MQERYRGLVDAQIFSKNQTFPHCDERVLHAPGECQYCDALPLWQALRVLWGIAFTGHQNDTERGWDHNINQQIQRPLIPCPSEWRRDISIINKWGGNTPRPQDSGD